MSEKPAAGPRLSIIVPTCKRKPALLHCLAGLANQSLPARELEVIVVDDAGTADPEAISPDAALPANVQIIRHAANSGAAAARNTGAHAARAPVIAFIDDDCVPEATWAERLILGFTAQKGTALAGEVTIGEPHRLTDQVTQLLSSPATASDGSLIRAQSANLAVPTAEFHEVEGFDERFHDAGYEDYEFCHRWRAAGNRIVAVPEAIVHHRRDTTLAGFWRQHYRYGRGAYLFYGGDEGAPRPSLASTWQRMTRTVSAGHTFSARIQHTGLVGLSQTALLAGIAAARVSSS